MAAANTECQIILHLLRANRDYLGRAEYSSLSMSENSPKQEKAGHTHNFKGPEKELESMCLPGNQVQCVIEGNKRIAVLS